MNKIPMDQLIYLVSEVFANRYIVEHPLGQGGMGCVVKIKTRDTIPLYFALKILSKKDYAAGANIYAEVYSLQELNHPGIPKIIEVKEDLEYVYIVQEFVHGTDFKKLILNNSNIGEETLVLWMVELAEIMGYLHSKGVIHRDIKPDNIMLEDSGYLRVIDFGLAKDREVKDSVDEKMVGTLVYTPPERFIRKVGDVQTDIYGYGATLYYLLVGEKPKEMRKEPIRNMQLMLNQLKPIASPAMFNFIKTCMAVDPQERYRSFGEVLYDAQRIELYNWYLLENQKKTKRFVQTGLASLLGGFAVVMAGLYMLL